MIQPLLQNDSFLADVAAARHASDQLHLWWLGQSGFLVQYQGRHLLIDPYLSDSLTEKYANTDKPHVRMTERVVAPDRLNFIDVVTSSHAHTDHLDPDTLRPLAAANPNLILVCPEATRAIVRERSGLPDERIVGMETTLSPTSKVQGPESKGQRPNRVAESPGSQVRAQGSGVAVGPFGFTAVPAAHEQLECDAQGRALFLGYVVKAGPWRLYHSGDTVLYDGMVDRLRPHQVTVAFLPINGRAAERRVAGNLWGREAAHLGLEIGASWVVPCHFEMFAFNTVSPTEFETTCQSIGQPFRTLRAGERLSLPAPESR